MSKKSQKHSEPARPAVQHAHQGRLAGFQPVMDRLIFAIALIGVIVTVHLIIQQGRGFDRGCLGFSAPAAEATFDCNAVVQSDAGKLFGVSNGIWGLLFYVVVTALSAGVAFATSNMLLRLKQVRAALIVFGFLYSMYLVSVSVFQIGELCMLCLTSAGVVTLLLILQAIQYFKHSIRTLTSPQRNLAYDKRYVAGLAVLVLLLVGADVTYFSSLEEAQPALAPVSPIAAGEGGVTSGVCTYTTETLADYTSLIRFDDPMKGSPDAPVTVIEVFEPNCPHCGALHPIMIQAAEQFGDQAKFYFKPVIFWPEVSVVQVHALYAAAQEGKYFEMLDRQFALQNPQGLSLGQLESIAAEIGMDSDAMRQRIQDGAYNAYVNRDDMELRMRRGISSVPMVTINGRVVDPRSRTVECLGQLISEAAGAMGS
jgi:uncharacterized membrane protein/thiol-disulfide isomerase/thioredoxin